MMRMRHPLGRVALVAGLLAPLAAILSATAAPPEPTAKQLFVQGINDSPTWIVSVDVDHKDRVYRVEEYVTITVRSEREGYLYLFNVGPKGDPVILFPNKYQSNNKIAANEDVVVPGKGGFGIQVREPSGKELVKAIVTTQPLKEINLDDFKKATDPYLPFKGNAKRLQFELLGDPGAATQGGVQEYKDKLRQQKPEQYLQKTKEWADHEIEITTIGRMETNPTQGPNGKPKAAKRVGIFVGISDYKDANIPGLHCCHRDAEEMAKALAGAGGLDQTIKLTNKDATFRAIQQAICEQAKDATRPGDVVFIFWSGHGGRCANTDGTEADGFDEFLVPYDGKLDDNVDVLRASMVLDDTFGRWVQELDGRRVVVILDTCHSGGQIAGSKSVKLGNIRKYGKAVVSKTKNDDPTAWKKKHFLDTELARLKRVTAKDINPTQAIVLASSTAKQISFERPDETLSVMTYFVVKALNDPNGPKTLEELSARLEREVPDYVSTEFPGTTQTPVLAPKPVAPPFAIRP